MICKKSAYLETHAQQALGTNHSAQPSHHIALHGHMGTWGHGCMGAWAHGAHGYMPRVSQKGVSDMAIKFSVGALGTPSQLPQHGC